MSKRQVTAHIALQKDGEDTIVLLFDKPVFRLGPQDAIALSTALMPTNTSVAINLTDGHECPICKMPTLEETESGVVCVNADCPYINLNRH